MKDGTAWHATGMRAAQTGKGWLKMRQRRLKSLATLIVLTGLVSGAVASPPVNDRTTPSLICNPFMCGDNHNQVLI
jgi:hypothetical protein